MLKVRGRVVSVIAIAVSVAVAIATPAVANAGTNVKVSGPSEFKNWLYTWGRVGAVIKVEISDRGRKLRTVQWCLNRGGYNNDCETKSLSSTGWKVPSGWKGSITFMGSHMPTQGCYFMDQDRPKVDFVIRVFDSSGRQVGRGHHLMTETCNAVP